MSHSKVLSFIRCPVNQSELALADGSLIEKINAAIRARRLVNSAGRTLDEHVDGALIRTDQEVFYQIVRGIPILLRDEAVAMDQL